VEAISKRSKFIAINSMRWSPQNKNSRSHLLSPQQISMTPSNSPQFTKSSKSITLDSQPCFSSGIKHLTHTPSDNNSSKITSPLSSK
jgi:hypothetical protein